jgi:hypothetical protein
MAGSVADAAADHPRFFIFPGFSQSQDHMQYHRDAMLFFCTIVVTSADWSELNVYCMLAPLLLVLFCAENLPQSAKGAIHPIRCSWPRPPAPTSPLPSRRCQRERTISLHLSLLRQGGSFNVVRGVSFVSPDMRRQAPESHRVGC